MNGHIVHRLEPQPEPSADLSPPTSATSARASMSRWVGAQPRWLFSLSEGMPEVLLAAGGWPFVLAGVCLPWSGGCGGGREPGAAVEEPGECVEGVDAPLGGGGQAGLDDGEVGEPCQGAPAAAGGPHLDLDRPDIAFCLI